MIQMSKSMSAIMFMLALGLGLSAVFIFVWVPLGTLRIVFPQWSSTTNLLWDVGLSVLFFLQHSGMIRKPFRAWLGRFIDSRYYAAIYSIASSVALAAVVLLWQPTPTSIISFTEFGRYLLQGMSLIAVGIFIWGARSLRPFDPLGLAPLVAHLRHKPQSVPTFIVRGPYQWVRHPLYLASLILIWSCPDITMDRLLFQLLWSVWIVIGAQLEEADLLAEFGDAYRSYCHAVPMIVPWPKNRKNIPFRGRASYGSSWAGERGQGYVVIQLLLILLVLLGPRSWPGLPVWSASMAHISWPIGMGFITFGLGLIVTGMVALGRNLTALPRPKQGATLVERGPYRVIRHPMYTGVILLAFGWALSIASTLMLVYAFMVVGFLVIKIAKEECWLREEVIGYSEYERRVRRLIPFIY